MTMEPVRSPAHQSVFHRALAALVVAASRYPRIVVFAALALAGASVAGSLTSLKYLTQRSDLISPHKDSQQRWKQYLAEFGEDDDIVVVVQGANRARMQAALDALAAQVAKQNRVFERLFYKVDLRPLHNRALLFLPTDQIQQIQDNLQSMKLLLEFGPLSWRALTLVSLFQEARHRAGVIRPGQPLRDSDQQFLAQLHSIARTAAATLEDPESYHNPWGSLLPHPPQQKDLMAEPQYFFSGDGTLAFLLVRPIKDLNSFTSAQKSVDCLRSIVEGMRERFADIKIGLTGMPVLETDEMVAACHDTQVASWLAILAVTLLFIVVYRGIHYPLLTVATLLLGTTWAMGWTTLTIGHLNILSATFAVMLIGMGDYGVLWVMRYEFERQRGEDIETALRHTALCVGAGTLTAALTTAMAFFAAMLADFQAVTELGWIAGSGVLLCAFSCFTVLPALLTLTDRRHDAATESGSLPVLRFPRLARIPAIKPGDIWLPGLFGASRWVMAGGVVMIIILGIGATGLRYDHNLLHLQARDLDSVRWELTLIDHTAGATWHALSYTSSPEEALALKARYEKLPEVGRVVEAASLVPRDQDQKLPLLRDIQSRLRNLPDTTGRIPHARPDRRDVRSELSCLIGQLQPLADTSPEPLLADLRRSLETLYDRLGDVPSVSVALDRLQEFEERMAADLAADLHRLRAVSAPQGITLADLPTAFRERYIGKNGKWLLQVFGKESLWDYEPLEHFVKQIQSVDPDATGKPFGTIEGLRGMKQGFEAAGLYALLAIIAVLFADFRNIGRTVIAIAPLAAGVTMALGILGLLGIPLNPANMIALPLVLGVGVDNGVHILHDYLASKAEGQGTLSRAIGRGVLVKALTTMIGFGTLMISTERGLAGLGFCLTLGVGCCMIASLIFLPAFLHLVGPRLACDDESLEPVRQAA
jgi:uncharacterized protein